MSTIQNINAEKIKGNLSITSVSATTLSAVTLSVNTISATTFSNIGVFITGGTYNTGSTSLQLFNNVGGSQIISGFTPVTIEKIGRSDYYSGYSYCALANIGSAESSPVWTITRITVNNDGSVISAIATNVAWTDRYTAIYT